MAEVGVGRPDLTDTHSCPTREDEDAVCTGPEGRGGIGDDDGRVFVFGTVRTVLSWGFVAERTVIDLLVGVTI